MAAGRAVAAAVWDGVGWHEALLLTDPQGTPLAKADAQGNIVERYEYTPYGAPVPSMGASPSGQGYTGHVNDPETGLVYMQARYYDPSRGGFLSVGPVAPAPGNTYSFNRYGYASNNPIMNIDPDGQQSVGEMINSGAEGCGSVSCAGWAALDAVWTMAGAEGVSQVADKGWANTSSADRASAGLEIVAVLPLVKIVREAASVLKTAAEVADAAKGIAKGKNIVAPGGREAAKSLFREADVAGKGGARLPKMPLVVGVLLLEERRTGSRSESDSSQMGQQEFRQQARRLFSQRRRNEY